MAPEYLKGLGFFLGLAVVIFVAAAFGEWYVQRKVERWARTRGLRLLEFSGVSTRVAGVASGLRESRFAGMMIQRER